MLFVYYQSADWHRKQRKSQEAKLFELLVDLLLQYDE